MVFYVVADGYFCLTILSYALRDYEVNSKERQDFQIPGVRTHNPYMDEHVDFSEVEKGKDIAFEEEEKKGREFEEASQMEGAFE